MSGTRLTARALGESGAEREAEKPYACCGCMGALHSRRHVIPHCYGTHPSQSQSKFNPPRDRRAWLSAIGQSLKDQYDALSPPMPPHLAVLVRQLETQK